MSSNALSARASELIAALKMVAHPEGGYFSEVYRSPLIVQPQDARPPRLALTTIYFLLTAGDVSRWHRVASDEAWHFYEGAPLELFTSDEDFAAIRRHLLGPLDTEARPVHVVPAHEWQAARTTGAFTLVGCSVGPGFEFADFEMLNQRADAAADVSQRHPQLRDLI